MKVTKEEKIKAKEVLIQKLHGMRMKSDQPAPKPENAKNYTSEAPPRVPMPGIVKQEKVSNYFEEEE